MKTDYPNFISAVQQQTALRGNKAAYTFLIDGEEDALSLSYNDLDQQARRLAGYLQEQIGVGQRAVLVYPTGLEFIIAFVGCLYGGIIPVPVPEPVSPRHLSRLRNIILDAQTVHILTTTPMLALINAQFGDNPEVQSLSWLTTDTISADWSDAWQEQPLNGDSIAFLQYTSGSTGVPKGVIVSHRNLLANTSMVQMIGRLNDETRFVSWLPLFHDLGLIGVVLQTIYMGAHCTLMSPFSFLQKPIRWLKAISRYKADVSGGPNFAYELCARKAATEQLIGLDLSRWRIAFNGAEQVRPRTLSAFSDAFKAYGFRKKIFLPCYGLAEATLYLSAGPLEAAGRLITVDAQAFQKKRIAPARQGEPQLTLVSCGRIDWLDQQAKIVDPETGRLCAPDEVGELWTSAAQVAQGYWQREAESQATFGAYLTESGEGPFLRTGDLAYIDNGELFIAGRLKDLIIIDGSNHYPQDIELTVENAHPAIRKGCTCAFSIDVENHEQLVIIAEVQPPNRLETPLIKDEVVAAIRRTISQEHGLATADIALIKARTIHKTSSGKIQRHACQKGYLNKKLELI